MPTYFQRPENALKRAHEFIDVGKPQRALDALYDVIKSKKHRTWQKIHEPIMEKYLELCVELKKSHIAKEGLYQYKNICQQVNVKSLEDVVRKYLQMAEDRTETARQQSHQTVVDIDDLDVLQTPESLLLNAVSGEDTQDRADRAILTPWVKFLWESYRQCLDLLRNNSRVERLYQDVAQQAFQFCLKYSRKTEFRKLCDNLRTHLSHVINKSQHQQNAINLNNPESLQMHLETRLAQLDAGIKMELWQEAFKAVEDIHNLISMSKKPSRPSLMANYYSKFGLVLWKAGSHLFHAATSHRLLLLTRDQKKSVSQEELQRMSNRALCATLAVPIPPTRCQIDQLLESNDGDKRRRLASLLSLANPPTRASLIKDLVKNNVLQGVSPELKNLYQWLEVDFHPLTLASKVQQCLAFIERNEDLAPYVTALQEITVVRLVKQVAQAYQTIEFSRLRQLAPFISAFDLERIVVQSAKNIDLPVRINHQTQSLSFGADLNVCLQEDSPEGPFLQHMPGDLVRNQLQHVSHGLRSTDDKLASKADRTKDDELRMHIINIYKQTAKKEHARILTRRQIIEERKEELEKITVQRAKEEDEREAERQRVIREAEAERLRREMEERDRQRKLQEHQEIKRQMAKERIEQLKKTDIGERALRGLDEEELADLDTDEILKKQVEQLEKEKKELAERLKAQEKKVDHFIRAKRLEEVPLLEKFYEDESVKNKEFWEQQEAQRIDMAKKEREMAMQHKDRLTRMLEDKNEYLEELRKVRRAEYAAKLRDYERLVSDARKKALAERKEARREERRAKYLREKEEAEQKALEERLRREREEKEQQEREKKEREEKEYLERKAKLEAQAEKQRQREREVEERLREKQQLPIETEKASSWRSPAKISWRDREASRREDEPDSRRGDDVSRRADDLGRHGEENLRRGEDLTRRDDHSGRSGEEPPKREELRRDDFGRREGFGRRDDFGGRRDDDFPRRGDDFPRRGDDFPRRGDDFPRRGDDFPRRGDDFPRRGDDFPRRGDDFSRRGDDLPRRGDDFPRRGDDLPRRGDDFTRRGDDFPRRGDDFSRRGDDFPRRGDDFPRRGDDFPRRGDDFPRRGDDLPRRGGDFSRRGDDFPRRGDDFSRRADDLPRRGDDLPRRGDDLPRRGDDLPRRGDDLPRRGDDLPRRGDDLPRRGDDLPRRGDDLPRRGDDFPRRGDDFPRRDEFGARRGDDSYRKSEDFGGRRGDDFGGRQEMGRRADDYSRKDELSRSDDIRRDVRRDDAPDERDWRRRGDVSKNPPSRPSENRPPEDSKDEGGWSTVRKGK